MIIDVSKTKLKEVEKIIRQFKKIYKDVHLKSTGTKKGRRVFIMYSSCRRKK